MATYPPRRLLGARPLPSDPRRDPRRSDFPPGGGGGRGERRLRTGQSWRTPKPPVLVHALPGTSSTSPSLFEKKIQEGANLLMSFPPFFLPFPQQFFPASSSFSSTV
ncbi:PREDICTED: uncharacterized protein LOC104989744 [Bison bison bison]|uniref:Uncharacterized protein LOC104989744 n=1 Tax=Bison bison bison TaxID=43346 RepID=A0A6P3H9C5_BISBB|nr:PREDICTED: uncharacterized protein LOC104989744 [Bison bison bison]